MPIVLAAMIPGFVLMQGSCTSFKNKPDDVEVRLPLEPWQLCDSLIQSGNALRRLDVLDLEGTAGLGTAERERMRKKILGVASGHARKYHEHLLELAMLPPQRVKRVFSDRPAGKGKISRVPDIVQVIELHLRLVRSDTPPSESRVTWDFGNLRYANPPAR